MKLAKTMRADQSILVNLSGRGDKDIGTVADLSNADFFCRPSCQGQSVKGGTEQPVTVVKYAHSFAVAGAAK
jgi:tryptophan synthase beta chain